MEKNQAKSAGLKRIADYKAAENQDALSARLNGKQPTIDIAGQTFFVDLHANLLRPKDDFSTMGISFPDINYCYNDEVNKYQFPYNPATHHAGEIDSTTLTELPKVLILVEIPYERELDPVGFAREHGLALEEILKEHPVKEHFQARIIPWSETPIPEIILDNLRKLNKDNNQRRSPERNERQRRTGRKL